MNINDSYFHFLNGNINNENIIDVCLYRLELILKTGYILSRNKQIEILGNYEEGVQEVNWNGFDDISICIKTNHNKYNMAFKEYTDDVLNAFELFSVDNSMCIILEKKLLEHEDIITTSPIYYLPGEFQIRNQIPIKYFTGIGIKRNCHNFLEQDYEILTKIKFLLQKYQIDLPVIDLINNEKIYSLTKNRRNIL